MKFWKEGRFPRPRGLATYKTVVVFINRCQDPILFFYHGFPRLEFVIQYVPTKGIYYKPRFRLRDVPLRALDNRAFFCPFHQNLSISDFQIRVTLSNWTELNEMDRRVCPFRPFCPFCPLHVEFYSSGTVHFNNSGAQL